MRGGGSCEGPRCPSHHNLGLPMAILLPLALLSALVTLAVEVPIDQQIQDWTVAALPRDWRSIQAR
jgi:hypothetical protein